MKYTSTLLLFLLFICSCGIEDVPEGDKWIEILGPSEGEVPIIDPDQAKKEVDWLDDIDLAFEQAEESDKPVFVTMRCLPCKQCSQFDQDVLENDDELKKRLHNFVCVRLTDMSNVDTRIFPLEQYQDLDLSWWGWFMSPKKEIYSVYGGKDEISDTTRISVASLIKTCDRVLDHHYDPRREAWGIDSPIPDLSSDKKTPKDYPGYQNWFDNSPKEYQEQACLHCHQVSEIIRDPLLQSEDFDPKTAFEIWPYPDNLGIIIDRDDGLVVKNVLAGSYAENFGMVKGDEIAAINGRKVFSQADIMSAFHQTSAEENVEVQWVRQTEDDYLVLLMDFEPDPGWKATEVWWRKSVAEARFGSHWGASWPLEVGPKHRKIIGVDEDEMAITPWFGPNSQGVAIDAGLEQGDIVTAVNGEKPRIFGRQFNFWFKKNFEPGDSVHLSVIRNLSDSLSIDYICN